MPLTYNVAELVRRLEEALRKAEVKKIGAAVSGGSDSTALLYLLADLSEVVGFKLEAATVDHGLRPESAAEAEWVAARCRVLGVGHTTLNWIGWDGSGNLQDRARRARYGLLEGWAASLAIDTIALGHTMDDQAETLLMRLARGSGIDGLSGMAEWRQTDRVSLWRPLLRTRRQDLRDYLIRRDCDWIEDPSNEDRRYDRIKARQALQALAPLGLDAQSLSTAAANLGEARKALDLQAYAAARDIARVECGDVVLERAGFSAQSTEISRRLLVHAIKWVSSTEYGPRGPAIADILAAMQSGKHSTLSGCRILAKGDGYRITRELQAVKDESCQSDAIWDRRWRLSGPVNKGLVVRALGESGISDCPDWRETTRPRASVLASPSVWNGNKLVAAPLAGRDNGWTANLIHSQDHFFTSILSH